MTFKIQIDYGNTGETKEVSTFGAVLDILLAAWAATSTFNRLPYQITVQSLPDSTPPG